MVLAVVLVVTGYYAVQGDFNFESVNPERWPFKWNPKCEHSNEILIQQFYPVVMFIMLQKVVITLHTVY